MVTFKHVYQEYRRGRGAAIMALRDVSIHIPSGEFCALTGPSGSGKSTFLNLVAGLDMVTSGEILLAGRSTHTFSDDDWTTMRRQYLGMIFQAFHLVPDLTAIENVALPLLLAGEPAREVRRRAWESLELVGMQGRAQHRPSELSGGEQQRVAIARAFIHRPQLILADEPTGNLDSQNGAEVVGLLRRFSQEFGQTVILATHSQAAAHEADRQYVLHDGQLTT